MNSRTFTEAWSSLRFTMGTPLAIALLPVLLVMVMLAGLAN